MVSDFRRKKLLYSFKKFFHGDENGSVTKEGFDRLLTNVAKLQGWKETDTAYGVAKDVTAQIWEGFKTVDLNNDGIVTADEWIALWNVQGSELPEWIKLYCKLCFSIQDATADGAIDEEEFVKVHVAFKMPKEDVTESFKMASQGKSAIDWEEFQKLFYEFFMSDDVNAPGNYIFGTTKLVKE